MDVWAALATLGRKPFWPTVRHGWKIRSRFRSCLPVYSSSEMQLLPAAFALSSSTVIMSLQECIRDSCNQKLCMQSRGLDKERSHDRMMRVHERSIGGATCQTSRHGARGFTCGCQSNEPTEATQERLAALFRQAVAVALWNTGRRLGVAVP